MFIFNLMGKMTSISILNILRDSNLESMTPSCELTNGKQKLIATNHFINASNANLFLVFAEQV